MTDRTTIDSSGSEPSQHPGVDQASRAAPAAPPKKARRPRPTFEDGALTRTFKFPSKTYPRSSYYVTGTEIIIRIKKARKKWKMTIPKKRVVSYRTNRWFAKPRWIAIELTYTQAVKLGLAEARERVPVVAPVLEANNAAHPASLDNAYVEAAPPSSLEISPNLPLAAVEAERAARSHISDIAELPVDALGLHESAAIEEGVNDEDLKDQTDHVDLAAEQEGDEHFALTLDTDEFETDPDAEPEPEPEPEEPAKLVLPTPPVAVAAPVATTVTMAPLADTPFLEPRARVIPFVAPPQPARSRPRRIFGHAVATLAAALAGYALWAAFDLNSVPPGARCSGGETAIGCGAPIITGAINPSVAPPVSAGDEEPPLSPSEIAAVARTELAEQWREDAEAAAPVSAMPPEGRVEVPVKEAAAREAVAIVLPGRDLVLPVAPPLITASVDVPKPAALAQPLCDALGAMARDIHITFDYARSRLDPGVTTGLDDLAAGLRGCPDVKVLVEGHTDTDGRAANNRSLSLRRAEAVQKHLVASGIAAHRVEAVGFGQTRPAFPNVSPKNKRSNRRVVLVLTSPR
jgi:outer membrane protein OmpA-like peptidoglycan-associated protein